jgi:hypothetical protein
VVGVEKEGVKEGLTKTATGGRDAVMFLQAVEMDAGLGDAPAKGKADFASAEKDFAPGNGFFGRPAADKVMDGIEEPPGLRRQVIEAAPQQHGGQPVG